MNELQSVSDQTSLLLIRHGQALSNLAEDFSTNRIDDSDELTELGKAQAVSTGVMLRGLWYPGTTILLSSTLKRARVTAQLIAEQVGTDVRIVFDDRLIEKNKAETFDDAGDRAMGCIVEYSSRSSDLVCITHGHVIQSLTGRCLDVPDPENIIVFNGGISYIRGKRLIWLNMVAHLINPHCLFDQMY